MEWIVSKVLDGNCILDARLKDVRKVILVTYETASGRRHVKQAECSYGRITKILGGKIVAWMPLPEPYRGQARPMQDIDRSEFDIGP